MTKTPKIDEKQRNEELHPDSWERFEKAIDKVVKGGPQHKIAKDQKQAKVSPKKP